MLTREIIFAGALGVADLGVSESAAVPFRDRPLEDRVCPDVSEEISLEDGRVITKSAGQFCYAEKHTSDGTLSGRQNIEIFYEEEATLNKDAWSRPRGYTKLVRQLIVAYEVKDVSYEIAFITSPHADGRGFYDREGVEVLYLTKTEEGKRMKNDFVWFHGAYASFVLGKGENTWEDKGILQKVESIMTMLRGKVYDAARTLRTYRLTFDPVREKNPHPIIFSSGDIRRITEKTEKLYAIAQDKKE